MQSCKLGKQHQQAESTSYLNTRQPGMRALRGTWRAVALDLDGTTLNSSHALSARTVEAIQQLDTPPHILLQGVPMPRTYAHALQASDSAYGQLVST